MAAVRTREVGLHRAAGPRRLGRLPQHQDQGAAMKGASVRLSAMMFLQFFIWGAWYTTIAVYMTNQGMGTLTHWPFTVNPVAAIAAPFFVGLIADRYFATERVYGILHLIGGVLLLAVPRTTGSPG